jgi:hypothetical protein
MLTDEIRKPATILEDWRSAERELADAAEGSPEYDALAARVLELARAYRTATRELAATQTPVDPEPPLASTSPSVI